MKCVCVVLQSDVTNYHHTTIIATTTTTATTFTIEGRWANTRTTRPSAILMRFSLSLPLIGTLLLSGFHSPTAKSPSLEC